MDCHKPLKLQDSYESIWKDMERYLIAHDMQTLANDNSEIIRLMYLEDKGGATQYFLQNTPDNVVLFPVTWNVTSEHDNYNLLLKTFKKCTRVNFPKIEGHYAFNNDIDKICEKIQGIYSFDGIWLDYTKTASSIKTKALAYTANLLKGKDSRLYLGFSEFADTEKDNQEIAESKFLQLGLHDIMSMQRPPKVGTNPFMFYSLKIQAGNTKIRFIKPPDSVLDLIGKELLVPIPSNLKMPMKYIRVNHPEFGGCLLARATNPASLFKDYYNKDGQVASTYEQKICIEYKLSCGPQAWGYAAEDINEFVQLKTERERTDTYQDLMRVLFDMDEIKTYHSRYKTFRRLKGPHGDGTYEHKANIFERLCYENMIYYANSSKHPDSHFVTTFERKQTSVSDTDSTITTSEQPDIYETVDIRGDGSCFFRAYLISYYYSLNQNPEDLIERLEKGDYNNVAEIQKLKEVVYEYFETHFKRYRPFLSEALRRNIEDSENADTLKREYLDLLSRQGYYGGNFEMAILASRHSVCIEVYDTNFNDWTKPIKPYDEKENPECPPCTIYLKRINSNHYHVFPFSVYTKRAGIPRRPGRGPSGKFYNRCTGEFEKGFFSALVEGNDADDDEMITDSHSKAKRSREDDDTEVEMNPGNFKKRLAYTEVGKKWNQRTITKEDAVSKLNRLLEEPLSQSQKDVVNERLSGLTKKLLGFLEGCKLSKNPRNHEYNTLKFEELPSTITEPYANKIQSADTSGGYKHVIKNKDTLCYAVRYNGGRLLGYFADPKVAAIAGVMFYKEGKRVEEIRNLLKFP